MIACTALQAHFSFPCSATVCLLRVATPHTTIQPIHNSHRPYLLKRLGYRNRLTRNKILACIRALQWFQYEFTYPSNFILKKVVWPKNTGKWLQWKVWQQLTSLAARNSLHDLPNIALALDISSYINAYFHLPHPHLLAASWSWRCNSAHSGKGLRNTLRIYDFCGRGHVAIPL